MIIAKFRSGLKLILIFTLLIVLISTLISPIEVFYAKEKKTIEFNIWLSNPIKKSQTDLLIYFPIKIKTPSCIKFELVLPENINLGIIARNRESYEIFNKIRTLTYFNGKSLANYEYSCIYILLVILIKYL